jgi:pimeloyl-ACP methyl ester carboxylesterase
VAVLTATQTELREIEYTGGTVEISVTVRPGGGDLLLCLHGLGCAKESFDSAYTDERLTDLTICAFDFPGHGASGRLADPSHYSIQTYADITVGLVRQLEPSRLFLLCHSMGCAVGLVAAQDVRAHAFISVEGNLVSQDCGIVSRTAADQPRDRFVGTGYSRFRSSLADSPYGAERTWAGWYGQADPIAVHQSAQSLVEWSDSGKLLDLFTSQPGATYVHGSDSDLDYLLPSLRGIPVHAIPGAGHFPMLDNPDAFWQVVAGVATNH